MPRLPGTNSSTFPSRVVSLAPSATAILFSLGAASRVVGVTRWCTSVAPVGKRPRLGDCWDGDVEAVKRLRPDLVIGSVPYKAETVAALAEAGLQLLAMNPRSLADVYRDIHFLGRLLNREARAGRLVRSMQNQLLRLSRRARTASSQPRVYCEAWPNPLIASPGWVADLVGIGGGRTVPAAARRVTAEEVIASDPEIIVLAWAATGGSARPGKVFARPGWSGISAVRNRRIYVVRDEWLNTPAPTLLRGAHCLARIIHPEIFGPYKNPGLVESASKEKRHPEC